jgi:hypothetical protein
MKKNSGLFGPSPAKYAAAAIHQNIQKFAASHYLWVMFSIRHFFCMLLDLMVMGSHHRSLLFLSSSFLLRRHQRITNLSNKQEIFAISDDKISWKMVTSLLCFCVCERRLKYVFLQTFQMLNNREGF